MTKYTKRRIYEDSVKLLRRNFGLDLNIFDLKSINQHAELVAIQFNLELKLVLAGEGLTGWEMTKPDLEVALRFLHEEYGFEFSGGDAKVEDLLCELHGYSDFGTINKVQLLHQNRNSS